LRLLRPRLTQTESNAGRRHLFLRMPTENNDNPATPGESPPRIGCSSRRAKRIFSSSQPGLATIPVALFAHLRDVDHPPPTSRSDSDAPGSSSRRYIRQTVTSTAEFSFDHESRLKKGFATVDHVTVAIPLTDHSSPIGVTMGNWNGNRRRSMSTLYADVPITPRVRFASFRNASAHRKG